ncbi:MAG: hypothetical protein JW891_14515 [Candidatus Lokiarchaeota archaeon]|nr:hypothetical protein [Candidatus Lokiarchaeota archaeon]
MKVRLNRKGLIPNKSPEVGAWMVMSGPSASLWIVTLAEPFLYLQVI